MLDKYPGPVRLAFRDYPLKQLHPQAQAAAEASRCAGEQDKYWEYYDLLFATAGELKEPVLIEKARAAALDEDRFKACLAGGKYRAEVERDTQDAVRLGVTGTPGFFVNGIFLNGAVPASAFETLIDQELADRERQNRAGLGAEDGGEPVTSIESQLITRRGSRRQVNASARRDLLERLAGDELR